MAKYLDPKADLTFKKIFGEHKNLVISLLNALLPFSEAQKIKHLSVLFQPIESKSIWENCAKVLASKCNIELVPYLYLMFEWLRDFNWPGADIMFNRLLDIPIESLQGAYRYSLEQAKARNDVPWELCLLDFQEEYQVRRNTGDRSNAIKLGDGIMGGIMGDGSNVIKPASERAESG